MSQQLTLNLDAIAAEANRLHRVAQTHAMNAVEAAIECGKKLLEAKAGLKHGEFLPWLAENFEGSISIANKYMRVARELPPNSERVTNLTSLRQALALVAGDDDEPKEIPADTATLGVRADVRGGNGFPMVEESQAQGAATVQGLFVHERNQPPNEPPEPLHLKPRPMDVHFSSDKDDWGTPQELFDELHARFAFDRDVCASPWNAKCKKFWTVEHDGLSREWNGSCWMNPPYGDEIGKWMEKAYLESRKKGCSVVCLVPARVDTAWWWDFALKGSVEHVRGRLKFLRPDGEADAAPFPSAIVVFNNKRNRYISYGETRFILGDS